jgi:hypothetical protein
LQTNCLMRCSFISGYINRQNFWYQNRNNPYRFMKPSTYSKSCRFMWHVCIFNYQTTSLKKVISQWL